MLEHVRYNRALEANINQLDANAKEIFIEQEFLTQETLHNVGAQNSPPPSEVLEINTLFRNLELVPGLRIPYAVEVLGMPGAGKSTMINRYVEELWTRKKRHEVTLIEEGARSIKEEYGDLRYTDPFLYSMLGGSKTFISYLNSLKNHNKGMRVALSDRGQIDRRVFRRAFFSKGNVNPSLMAAENEFIYGLENTPMQIGGIIMIMARPEISMQRIGKPGPVVNKEFLPLLYEQYWRVHSEMMQQEIPRRVYTCIDGEKNQEEVYTRFQYAMDTALNIHDICLDHLGRIFPDIFDKTFNKAKEIHEKNPQQQTRTERILNKRTGLRVKIVGGDDMMSDEELLDRPIIEGIDLRNQ